MARATRVIYGKVDTYAWYVSLYAMHNTYDTYVYIHTRALQAWDWLRRLEKRGYVYVCPRVRVSVYVQNAHCNELLWLFPRFSIFFLYFTFFCFLSAVGAHLTYSPASFLFFFFFNGEHEEGHAHRMHRADKFQARNFGFFIRNQRNWIRDFFVITGRESSRELGFWAATVYAFIIYL